MLLIRSDILYLPICFGNLEVQMYQLSRILFAIFRDRFRFQIQPEHLL